MYDRDTLKSLHLRASGAVPLGFITAVFTRAGLQAGYPGGVPGFQKDYPQARIHRDLVTVSSMSGGELQEILDACSARGLDLPACCAVADAFGGPIDPCDDIEVFAVEGPGLRTRWMARARNASLA